MRILTTGLLACALLPATSAWAQDFSPLSTREYRPYSMLFLRFAPQGRLLKSGQSQLDFDLLAANDLNLVPNTTNHPMAWEDMEADRLNVRYSRGLGKGWEVAGEVPIENLGPGFLDPIISWYHHTFLHLHNIRDQIPYGGHLVYSPSGGPFGGGFGLGDTSLFVAKSTGHETLVRAGLKLPTGNAGELLGSGAVDAGLAAQTTWRLSRYFALTFNAGLTVQGNATRLSHTRTLVGQGDWTLVFAPNRRDSYVVQTGYEQSPVIEGTEALDKVEPALTIAYRRQLSANQTVTVYFMEDMDPLNSNFPIGSNIGPDFVIGLKWGLRL